MTEDLPWKKFCRALSTAGLPECVGDSGHSGAHLFAFMEDEILLDRCQVLFQEYQEALLELTVQAEANATNDPGLRHAVESAINVLKARGV